MTCRISHDSYDGQSAAVNDLVVDGEAAWLFQSDQWEQVNGTFNSKQTAAIAYLAPIEFDAQGEIYPLVRATGW